MALKNLRGKSEWITSVKRRKLMSLPESWSKKSSGGVEA
jgi:hypothetical protein